MKAGRLRIKRVALGGGAVSKAIFIPVAIVAAAAAISAPAASETVTYSYDALGRLVGTSTSGGPNDGVGVGTTYDPAGNRCTYTVGGAGGGGSAECPGGGGDPPGNQLPAAVDDSGSMTRCAEKTFAVLSNDSDPDGNLPLALVGVSYGGTRGSASISGTGILFTPSGVTGTAAVGYVMRDSLGATDSATLTISITNGDCGPIE